MRSLLLESRLCLNTISGLLLTTRSLNRGSERLIIPSGGPLAPNVFSATFGTCCLKTSGVILRRPRRCPDPRPGLQVITLMTHTVAKIIDTLTSIVDNLTVTTHEHSIYSDWCYRYLDIIQIMHQYIASLLASRHLSVPFVVYDSVIFYDACIIPTKASHRRQWLQHTAVLYEYHYSECHVQLRQPITTRDNVVSRCAICRRSPSNAHWQPLEMLLFAESLVHSPHWRRSRKSINQSINHV